MTDDSAEPRVQPAKRRTAKNRWMFLLKLTVSVGLFSWILSRTDLGPVLDAMSGMDLRWFFAAFLSQILGAAVIALRWQRLLAVREVEPGFAFLLNSTLSSLFFRQFMPSVIGGDALRGHDAWRAGASPGFALVSLFVDRLVGLLALALFAFAALLAFGGVAVELRAIFLPVCIGLLCLLAVLALMFWRRREDGGLLAILRDRLPARLAEKLTTLSSGLRVYGGEGRVLTMVFALSIVLQVNVVTFYWMLSQALDLGVPYFAFYAIVPLAIFVMMIPITVNGIGLRETIFVFLLSSFAVEREQALAFAWLEFGLVLIVGAVGGIVYLSRRNGSTRPESP